MITSNTYTSVGVDEFDALGDGFDDETQESKENLAFITASETNELISKLETILVYLNVELT